MIALRHRLGIASFLYLSQLAHAGLPVVTITGFHRDTNLYGYATGCGEADYPKGAFIDSDDFAAPGGTGFVDASINGAYCAGEVHGIEHVSTEATTDGPVMQFALALGSGCVPGTTCPTSLVGSIVDGRIGEYLSKVDGVTDGFVTFEANEGATVTITTTYTAHADLSGADVSWAYASAVLQSQISGPGANPKRDTSKVAVGHFYRAGQQTESATKVSTLAAIGGDAFSIDFHHVSIDGFFNLSSPTAEAVASSSIVARINVRVTAAGFDTADLDGDGNVNATDLSLLLGAWGTFSIADIDGDGTVGASDLAMLLGSWTS